MSNSNPQVTITLGRTGQVVTRKEKRPKGDRFGSSEEGFSSSNKRHQGDGIKWSPGSHGGNGSPIARNDLRRKLMHKRMSKPIQNVVEKREKIDSRKRLSNAIQPPVSASMLLHRRDPNGNNLSNSIFDKEIACDLHQVDSLGNLYSSHNTMARPRPRSPDRIFRSSIVLSPARSFDEMQQVTRMRAADVSSGGRFLSNEIPDASRFTGSMPITVKTTSHAGNLIPRVTPSVGIMQKVSHVGKEPLTVAGFLQSLDLGKYAITFQAEEVDMTVLKQMGDNDLKEMGIPMGPRKKILLALLPPSERQTSRLQL